MKNKLLLPTSFKIVGLVLVILSLALFIAWNNFNFQFQFLDISTPGTEAGLTTIFEDHNLTNELFTVGLLAGLICIAFARDRHEDERSTMIRLRSLQLSHYLSYAVFIIALFSIDGLSFLLCTLYLPFVFLVTFILIFYSSMYLLPKFAAHEE